jgi:tetratricopeptide (TPR) repeat protein
MWPNLSEIDTEVQLNMYELHATLLIKQNLPEKAIDYAEAGIQIARRVKNYDRCFELWTTLGRAYKQLGQLLYARHCFETALRFEKLVSKRKIPAYNYTELGLLHWMEGQYQEAEECLQKAARLGKLAKDGFREYEALYALGKYYLEQNNENEAISYLEMAREIAQKHSLLRQERNATVLLIDYYKERDMFKAQKYFARLVDVSVQLLDKGGDNVAKQFFALETQRKIEGDPPDD